VSDWARARMSKVAAITSGGRSASAAYASAILHALRGPEIIGCSGSWQQRRWDRLNSSTSETAAHAGRAAATTCPHGTDCDFRFWQILLQKSAVTGDVVRPFTWGRRGLAPDPDALYATFTLRNTQSLSGWRPRDEGCESPQVLGDGSQNKLILGASWAA
jgi:hypothetical protein